MDISPALSSATAAFNLVKIAISARDEAKVQTAVVEMTVKLLDLSTVALASKEAAMALQDQVRALKNEIHDLKLKRHHPKGYELALVRPGACAYKRQVGKHGHDDVPHYLCHPCHGKGVNSILQLLPATTADDETYACPEVIAHKIVIPGTRVMADVTAFKNRTRG